MFTPVQQHTYVATLGGNIVQCALISDVGILQEYSSPVKRKMVFC